ncbi:hypothetical protein [Pseudosulfitobacter pseudonitzschiae]|uniref:hypothetical protein n=1 Tax=Pseudosulfitobacter pseudonitzschiae TaxID=1402135 RepID=UPI003B8012D7
MPDDLTLPDPSRFNLTRFSDLLPERDPIIGEDPGSFDGFREGLMHSLVPLTPYEGVVAENLIAIEWELIQHRRMRDAGLRTIIKQTIKEAIFDREDACLRDTYFDRSAAETMAVDLSARAISRNSEEMTSAHAEIEAMGLDVVELMGEAYLSSSNKVWQHDNKLQELERRRREVKRDFDLLQRARPVEVEVIEG